MNHPISAAACVLCCLAAPILAPSSVLAQTANSSPTAGSGAGGGNVSRTPPSGGTARPNPGQAQIGAPTPLEQKEEQKSQKDTDICKGC